MPSQPKPLIMTAPEVREEPAGDRREVLLRVKATESVK
jgi:hypothetical protein